MLKQSRKLAESPEQQMVLELRPSHDPTRTFGFAGVVASLKDLSASVWLWKRDNGHWGATKVIEIPAEPADPDLLPPALKAFKRFHPSSPTSTDLEKPSNNSSVTFETVHEGMIADRLSNALIDDFNGSLQSRVLALEAFIWKSGF
jgi:hypothetical protein